MLVEIRGKVAALKDEGKPLDEAIAEKPAVAHDAMWGNFLRQYIHARLRRGLSFATRLGSSLLSKVADKQSKHILLGNNNEKLQIFDCWGRNDGCRGCGRNTKY